MVPSPLPSWFGDFLAPGIDRPGFLKKILHDAGVASNIVSLKGKTHLIASFGQSSPAFPVPLAVVAHHDRERDTPGANDNSAACALLVEFAAICGMKARGPFDRQVLVVFSGGEEASSGVASQGAYGLATGLRCCGVKSADCVVLDGIGRGDTVILSESTLLMFSTSDSRASAHYGDVLSLDRKARGILDTEVPGKWLSLPTPFSDNAGLVSGGLAACCLSVLPGDEALRYGAFIRDRPRIIMDKGYHDLSRDALASPFIPETWKRFHSVDDCPESLDPAAFASLPRILSSFLR